MYKKTYHRLCFDPLKTIGTFFIVLFFLVVQVFWNEWTDCIEVARLDKSQFADAVIAALDKWLTNAVPPVPSYTLQIFTPKDLWTALYHTQQYCCQESTNSKDCAWKLDGQHYFAESPYLIDHLVNVWMRKFNWIQEHCDALQIDCNTPSTNTVLMKEWRQEVTKVAEDIDGAPPSQLYELFKKYWWEEKDFIDSSKQWLLANAYFTMCDEVVKIKQSFSLLSPSKSVENQAAAWREWCRNLILQRYREEAAYVQSLMVSRWVAYVSNNMQAYLKTHFIDNRLNRFVDKIGNMDACFNMVLKYVTRTSCCVH